MSVFLQIETVTDHFCQFHWLWLSYSLFSNTIESGSVGIKLSMPLI